MPNWQELDVKDALAQLQTVETGLTEKEAAYRLEKTGPNELKEENKINPVKMFLAQFTNFLIVILILATVFSAAVGEVLDAIAIFIIVVLCAIFGFLQEYRAEKSMAALKKLTNPETIVLRDGQKRKVRSSTLVPGDIIILEQGDKIPADARIVDVVEFKVDESAITGESNTVKKVITLCKTSTLADMKCMVFMGTIAAYGRATAVVVRTGMETEVGKIAHEVQTTEEEDTPLQKALDKFGKNLGVLILGISAVVIAIGLLRGGDVVNTIILGVALAVAAIPEGLPAIVTITLAIGMKHMAKNNAIMRRLHAVETLGSVSVICSDKTGTITKNEMTIRKIWLNYKIADVMGSGYEPTGDILLEGNKVEKNDHLAMLLRAGTLCTNSQLRKGTDGWEIVGDPTEGAINVAAEKFGIRKEDAERENTRKGEIPFTSERKMMSTVNKYGDGMIMCTKGAPEIVVANCTKVQFGPKIIDLTKDMKTAILDANNTMSANALRVLAIAYRQVNDTRTEENDLVFLGLVGMIDPPRPEVVKDVELCKRAGIKIVMITGDNKNTAMAIAKEIGIPADSGLTGEDLDKMTDEQLSNMVETVTIYARVNPIHKAKIVDALRTKGHIIAMTGDGINDAPAIKKADIGIAMGIKGTDVAKEASGMILADDNFSTIVAAVKDGRNIYDNIKYFVGYLLSSNMAEVMVVLSAILMGFTDSAGAFIVPFTAIQLLWINLVTDGLPAIAMGLDPPVGDIMTRKPRDPKERLLSKNMLIDVFMTGAAMAVIVIVIFIYYYLRGDIFMAYTVAFTSIVMLELLNIFRLRVEIGQTLTSNRTLVYAVLVSVFLQLIVIYVPFLDPIFETEEIGLIEWGIIALGGLAFAAYSYLRLRFIVRRKPQPKQDKIKKTKEKSAS